MNREDWLIAMASAMEDKFNSCDYYYPSNLQISTGFGTSMKALGQCIYDENAINILINPKKWYSMDVAEVLCHELIHACVYEKHKKGGHGVLFKDLCRSLGLRPTRFTGATPEFIRWVRPLIDKLGPYPHKKINVSKVKKRKQASLKIVRCPDHDYWVRVDTQLLNLARVKCPICEKEMLTKDEM